MTLNAQHPAPVALVTGANRGIGLEVCRQLAQRGMTVVLTARDAEQGAAAAVTLAAEGLAVHAERLDVTDAESVAAVRDAVESLFGRLDVLVNNAAGHFDYEQTTLGADLAVVQAALETNLLGPWRLCQAFLPLLRLSGGGRIVNVSSEAGSFTSPGNNLAQAGGGLPAYGVSKTALNAFTVKLAAELAGTDILVNAVCPGWTATYPGGEAQGARPVAAGAASVVWAATLHADGPTGGFFRDGKPLAW